MQIEKEDYVPKEVNIQAGYQLLKENKTVTPWRLRRVIGKGTPAKLYEVWLAHCAENDDNQSTCTEELPGSIREEIEDFEKKFKTFATNIFQASNLQADNRVKELLKTVDDIKNKSHYELDDAERVFYELENEKHEIELQVTARKIEIEEINKQKIKLETWLEAERASSKTQKDEISELKKELSNISSQRDEAVGELKAYKNQLQSETDKSET